MAFVDVWVVALCRDYKDRLSASDELPVCFPIGIRNELTQGLPCAERTARHLEVRVHGAGEYNPCIHVRLSYQFVNNFVRLVEVHGEAGDAAIIVSVLEDVLHRRTLRLYSMRCPKLLPGATTMMSVWNALFWNALDWNAPAIIRLDVLRTLDHP